MKNGNTDKGDALYREEQRFTQWFVWALLLGVLAIPTYGVYRQIIQERPFGSNPMPDTGLLIFFLITVGVCVFFWWIRLRTSISNEYIHIHYAPLVNKKIFWRDVTQAEIVTYSPLIGYGLRIWTPYGTVYNVKGRKGLFMILKNGKKVMIGTQRPREIEEVVRKVMKSV